jgi:nicotinate-nucleotide--dimethylbenzimidazole phosphoribosyltransferase
MYANKYILQIIKKTEARNMNIIEEIKKIEPLKETSRDICQKHWDNITKPLDSLGLLEKAIIQIGTITEQENILLNKKAVVAMCADNGVIAEGVTQTDNSVTAIVTENMAAGIANVNVMGKISQTDVFTVDIGVASDLKHDNIVRRKVAYGTKNFTKEPAMTLEQAEQAIITGMEITAELKKQGYKIVGLGEMGIGNTTTSSALTAVFLNQPVEKVTGPGAGLSQAGINRKISAIQKGIKLHNPDPQKPLQVLAALGGLDIAGLVGVILGCAVNRLPVVLDGFISYAAALTAIRLAPAAKPYIMASHISKEPASQMLMAELELQPIIYGEMSLGEGTGAVALFPLLEMALAVYNQNNTFADSNIEAYQHFDQK